MCEVAGAGGDGGAGGGGGGRTGLMVIIDSDGALLSSTSRRVK